MTCWTIKLTTECLWTWLTHIGADRSTRKSSSNIMFLTRFALTEPMRVITVRYLQEQSCFPTNVQRGSPPKPVKHGNCLEQSLTISITRRQNEDVLFFQVNPQKPT